MIIAAMIMVIIIMITIIIKLFMSKASNKFCGNSVYQHHIPKLCIKITVAVVKSNILLSLLILLAKT